MGVQIETTEGAANLDAILAVPHVDFVFLGPTDLSSFLGCPGELRHPDVLALMEELGERVLRCVRPCGRAGNASRPARSAGRCLCSFRARRSWCMLCADRR